MLSSWLLLSFIVTFSLGIYICILKYIGNLFNNQNLGIGVSIIGIFYGIFSSLYLLYNKDIFMGFRNVLTHSMGYIFAILFITSLIIFINIFLQMKLYTIAPNPGYALGIVNLNVIITTLVGYFFFNSPLYYKTNIGILISIIGVSIICLTNT